MAGPFGHQLQMLHVYLCVSTSNPTTTLLLRDHWPPSPIIALPSSSCWEEEGLAEVSMAVPDCREGPCFIPRVHIWVSDYFQDCLWAWDTHLVLEIRIEVMPSATWTSYLCDRWLSWAPKTKHLRCPLHGVIMTPWRSHIVETTCLNFTDHAVLLDKQFFEH